MFAHRLKLSINRMVKFTLYCKIIDYWTLFQVIASRVRNKLMQSFQCCKVDPSKIFFHVSALSYQSTLLSFLRKMIRLKFLVIHNDKISLVCEQKCNKTIYHNKVVFENYPKSKEQILFNYNEFISFLCLLVVMVTNFWLSHHIWINR